MRLPISFTLPLIFSYGHHAEDLGVGNSVSVPQRKVIAPFTCFTDVTCPTLPKLMTAITQGYNEQGNP